MKKYQPKQIEKHLENLYDTYRDMLQEYANEVMKNKIIPHLHEKELSFCMMNGWPQVYNKQGERQPLPKIIENLCDVCDPNCDPIKYYFNDYNPFAQNFSELDIKILNRSLPAPYASIFLVQPLLGR
jgi:hypothetical protein